MLKKRIIACLDVQNGRTVKGVNFVNIRDAGDPVELAARYTEDGADELVLLDISASNEGRHAFTDVVRRVAGAIDIPFTVGGGISSVESAAALLQAGADKLSVNSAAVARPQLIHELQNHFGTQSVVVAIDAKLRASIQSPNINSEDQDSSNWIVTVQGGREDTGLDAIDWAVQAVELGAGEILLTSIQHDGARTGFALELTNAVAAQVSVPLIASGGAGSAQDFIELFQNSAATGALAAGIFHYGELNISDLKSVLKTAGLAVR